MGAPGPASLLSDVRALVRVYRGGPLPHRYAMEARRPTGAGSPPVAVVLGAQVLRGGRPSETLRARCRHAARMFVAGEAGTLVVTGGLGEHPPREAEVMSGLLRSDGVPPEHIVEEGEARSTRESAVLVAALLQKRSGGTPPDVLIVTDPLHCIRAARAFLVAGLPVAASPAYGSPMWRVAWMRRGQFLREMGALVWYGLRERGQRG